MLHPLIERAKTERTPLIDGSTVTFVWHGDRPPRLIADFNGWESGTPAEMEAVADGLWLYSLELPLDAYIEYAYMVGEERVSDPFNPRSTFNGIGRYNHFFYMPLARPTDLIRRRPGIPRGEVFSLEIEPKWYLAGHARKVHFYRPPASGPYPLLLVWDGQDYLRRAHLPAILDNLITRRRIPPIALAMVENGRKARGLEYLCSEAPLMFLHGTVLPAARQNLDLVDVDAQPGAFGVLGASAGGLMALYTGLRMPHIFGRVLAQSGAYSLNGYDFVVWDLLRQIDPQALRIWLAAGCFEELSSSNRRMSDFLTQQGFTFEYDEYNGGHNYPSWRNEVGRGLEFLFG